MSAGPRAQRGQLPRRRSRSARELVDTVAEPWRATAERGPLLVVCDGMGGVEGGEVASELAAQVIWREMKATPATRDPEVFARLLRRATRVANHDVHAMAKREPGLKGMGTTVSAAGIVGDRLVIATVGDSRAYVLRGGVLVQVTQRSVAVVGAARRGPRRDRSGERRLGDPAGARRRRRCRAVAVDHRAAPRRSRAAVQRRPARARRRSGARGADGASRTPSPSR